MAHDGHEDQRTGDNGVDAIRCQTWIVRSITAVLCGQRPEDVFGCGAGELESVEPLAIVGGQTDLDGGHGDNGTGDADETVRRLELRNLPFGIVEV